MRIGVLSLQGGFAEHISSLTKLNAEAFEIRKKSDPIGNIDGLIIPGGESTVMRKLLIDTELFDPIKSLIRDGLPVFGTCAGMILLAKNTADNPMGGFDGIDITVKRNAYGRQLSSFMIEEEFADIGRIPMTFIRAPYITTVRSDVRILAIVNGTKVAAENKNILVTAFHPELTEDLSVHQYFLKKILMNKAYFR
ncbi:MAG: pyridoxal 5'-phosphate synthase glutaminase subunit PdxT [Eubacteriales bacterium]|nr:pyridoxal 5'-phosphate synthase glutaminase subunit PdxT [Eubacteriales bacterium]MDD3198533.1 pyridoxal 5'-phosphate synthase glutaminase subunit PdxT [Eubacteriales bacterium]MDD3504205.1 pyridoxal 5'-phosphate synthase glutaminase subunit PdxT [Eubacteriales bacterium]MDD4683365.1 pyridoxal 5'-phosphate synthase glutaminase subunit PdxT [Eubacteriales bacterium]